MLSRIITLLLSLLLVVPTYGNLFGKKPQFLKSEEAFVFSSQLEQGILSLNWQIADGYYLYKKEIRFTPQNVVLGEIAFPPSESHHDEFFGQVDIFRHQLHLQIPIKNQIANANVEVHYQGCTQGFCYPPETVQVDLQAVSFGQEFAKNQTDLTASTASTLPQAEQELLATSLSKNRLSIFWFFILGLGLAFTPCVLPMLPLLSAIVIGARKRPSSWRAFTLSLTYVQGMALTYTLLGLIVAAIGLPFQVALQSPPVLIGLSLVFVILAMSMFGLFELQLPHRWQQKLNTLSQQQQGGSYPNVFVMGMIAGLVASPCTSAPLSGALLYVAQSGDLLTGGLALYLLALGMGIPLMSITLFGNKVLPKAGEWLLKVKTLFGFVMLALPIFLLTRLLPNFMEPLLWSALAISILVWLNEQFSATLWWKIGLRALLLVALVLSAKPWTDLLWQPQTAIQTEQSHFTRITTLSELQQKLQENRGKKVMFDLYADWCVACKEFEKYTFADPQVKAELDKMQLLQVDMTRNSAENDQIMKQFQILGLPTILFFDENGNEIVQARVTGFMSAEDFHLWLKNLSP